MIDKLNGKRMGMPPTGSGRRQNYTFAPTSRMRNTYIAPGEDDEAEMIRTMGDGLYAKKMGGGSVNPATGEFNFAVSEGYLVKDGKIASPVRGASLIGKGADILPRIDRVGKAMTMDQGMCGSISGSVPTNVGQPMIRVTQIDGRRQSEGVSGMELTVFLEKLFAEAANAGLEAAEAYMAEDESFKAMASNQEITQYSSNLTKGLSFRVMVGGKIGYASTEAFDEQAVGWLFKTRRTPPCSAKIRPSSSSTTAGKQTLCSTWRTRSASPRKSCSLCWTWKRPPGF